MTEDLRPPFRQQFDNARDPYTARNALGVLNTSASAPVAAQYITAAADATLTAERVLTNTATVTWDFATAGQAKASTAGTATSADFPAGAWTTWTPTVTATTGTFTTTVNVARYTRMGKTIVAYMDVSITNAGTAAGAIVFTLPVTASASGGGSVYGVETVIGGYLVGGAIVASGTTGNIVAYNGSTLIGTNSRPRVNVIYEGA